MSFLGRGNTRGRRLTALAVGGALAAFQALAVIGAPTASAAATCTFSGGVVSVALNADGDTLEVQQQSNGQIFFGYNTAPGIGPVSSTLCGPTVLTSNTTAINITGGVGDQYAEVDFFDETGAGIDWGAINWTIALGSKILGNILDLENDGSDTGLDMVLGANGIDFNNDGDLDATVSGIDVTEIQGADVAAPDGNDTISAAGSTATGGPYTADIQDIPGVNNMMGSDWGGMDGGDGDDTLTGGSGNDTIGNIYSAETGDDTIAGGLGDDTLDGGTGGEDTVDYSASAAAVSVNLPGGVATGQGTDSLAGFEDIIGSAQADTLTGDGGNNVITPGAGDDKVDGGLGSDDVDYSDATAAVTVDLTANTETGGSGSDTLTSIEGAFGSAFDDMFVDQVDQDNEYFGGGGSDTFDQGADVVTGDEDTIDGESGVDTVDYGTRTENLTVDLSKANVGATAGSCNDPTEFTSGDLAGGELDCLAGLENAVLGTGDDSFQGNAFANRVWPNGGQNVLDGDAPAGPATGGDTLDYSVGYTTGVTVNMAGGATSGDSAVNFENAVGTDFKDNITGNASSNTINGGKGNDNLKSGSGDDTVRGGGGNDALRGGSGDDDLFGAKGNDTLFGGGGTDFGSGGPGKDVCKSVEVKHSCGTAKSPKKPTSGLAAKLA